MIDGLIAAFTLGLLGSTHCIGMCGPIAILFKTSGKSDILDRVNYNLGRTLTYSFLGFMIGIFGLSIKASGFQNFISILTGIILLIFLLIPRLWRLSEKRINQSVFIEKLRQLITQISRKRSISANGFVIGILNGLLPCGMVYVAFSGALQMGSPEASVLFMAFFGLGTIPLMLIYTIAAPKLLNRSILLNQMKYTLTIILALLFILRGLDLGIPFLSPSSLDQPLMHSHH